MGERWAVAVLMLGVLLLAGEASARGVGSAGTVASRGVTAGDAVMSISASISGHHTCVLSGDGSVRCWGENSSGQLGDGTGAMRLTSVPVSGLTDAVALAAGLFHTCARRADGGVRCWGDNFAGQLGDGTTTNRLTAVEVPSFRFNIDPAVELHPPGRVATVIALVACPEDQQVKLRISLNQGEAGGEGRAVEACTGQLERYPVRVHAHGRAFFEPGPAEAEAEGVVREHGAVVDIQEWMLEVELELVPPEHR